jgi:hypothetical protein
MSAQVECANSQALMIQSLNQMTVSRAVFSEPVYQTDFSHRRDPGCPYLSVKNESVAGCKCICFVIHDLSFASLIKHYGCKGPHLVLRVRCDAPNPQYLQQDIVIDR